MELGMMEIGLPTVTRESDIDELEIAKQTLLCCTVWPKDSMWTMDSSRLIQLIEPIGGQDRPLPMKLYFSPTGPYTETFNNNMTEHILSSLLRAQEGLVQIAQTLGVTGESMIQKVSELAQTGVGFVTSLIPGLPKEIEDRVSSAIGKGIKSYLSGYRANYPKIWSDSSCDISYPIGVVLECNDPDDDIQYEERIIKPLENILKYVLPRSDNTVSANSYKRSYLCTVECPGLFSIPEAIVASVTVEKGSQQSALSSSNRPYIVNVGISFINLRDTMIYYTEDVSDPIEFSLKEYIGALRKKKTMQPMKYVTYSEGMVNLPQTKVISNNIFEDYNKLSEMMSQITGFF